MADFVLSLFCRWIYVYVTSRLTLKVIPRLHTWFPIPYRTLKEAHWAGKQAGTLSLNILNEGISRLPVSGGVPCASAPLGGTIEPFAEVGIDAQKRGQNKGEERDKTP